MITVVIALTLAGLTGWSINRRSGVLRQTSAGCRADPDVIDLGLSHTGPTVVHFSAQWCGPCNAVRRVVNQACGDLGVTHVEIDIDDNPPAAQMFTILSLPTTLIFDAAGRQCYRTAGVPTVAHLRATLEPLIR